MPEDETRAGYQTTVRQPQVGRGWGFLKRKTKEEKQQQQQQQQGSECNQFNHPINQSIDHLTREKPESTVPFSF